jgi:SpoVK/Ycf46/Vps4 family AAA+-type ATPase
MFPDNQKKLQITVLRCDPIDQKAALTRLGIPNVTWTLSGADQVNTSGASRLAHPLAVAKEQSGQHVWKNYLSALASLDILEQQIICDQFHELYFHEFDAPCQIYILQTDSAPVPESIAFFLEEHFVPLPTTLVIQDILSKFAQPTDSHLIRLCAGLSHADLENCLASLDLKQSVYQQVESYRSRRLTLKGIKYDPPATNTEIGGLDLLVAWIKDFEFRLSLEAENLGLPFPRGILLAGVPGTGKTFAAKAIAAQLGYPMYSLSMNAVQSGGATVLVETLRIIEKCEPCILFVDEIEKLFGGGVEGRVLTSFLTWLNDKTAKVFVIGTLNRIVEMPIEMTRSIRFDKIFFVDSPGEGQRVELCRLFLKRYDDRFLDPEDPVFDPSDWQHFADSTIEYIGAEIQQIVQDTISRINQENPDAVVTINDLIFTSIRFKSMYKRNPIKVHDIRNALIKTADPASSNSRKFLPDRKIDIWAPVKSVSETVS